MENTGNAFWGIQWIKEEKVSIVNNTNASTDNSGKDSRGPVKDIINELLCGAEVTIHEEKIEYRDELFGTVYSGPNQGFKQNQEGLIIAIATKKENENLHLANMTILLRQFQETVGVTEAFQQKSFKERCKDITEVMNRIECRNEEDENRLLIFYVQMSEVLVQNIYPNVVGDRYNISTLINNYDKNHSALNRESEDFYVFYDSKEEK